MACSRLYGYRPDGAKTSQQVDLVSASNPGSIIGVGGTQTFACSANRWPLVDTGRSGEQVQRAYDPAGQLTAATDTSSGTTTSISRLLNTATRTVTTTVAGAARTTGWAWQADGRPDHMTAGDAGLTGIDSTQGWVYNNARLPVAETTTGWGGASSWATSYDLDGRPQSRTDPARTISRNSAWDSWRDRARASQRRHRPPSLVLMGSGKWAYLDRLKPRWGR